MLSKRAVYKAKSEAEKRRFSDVGRRDDQRNEVFKIAKAIVKTNQDIIGEQCIRNDEGKLAVTNVDMKQAWKSYHQHLLNTENDWEKDNLPEADIVSSSAIYITNEMVGKI